MTNDGFLCDMLSLYVYLFGHRYLCFLRWANYFRQLVTYYAISRGVYSIYVSLLFVRFNCKILKKKKEKIRKEIKI